MTADPIWIPPPPRPRTALPRRADVAIIGGGITGVALLRHLSQRGVDTVLLERDHLAAGASGRNAGFLLMGVAANYALAVRQYGRKVAREVWAFTAENHSLLAEALQGRAGHARQGSLTLAASTDEAELLCESVELLAEDDLPGRWLSAAEAPPFGGLLNPADGELDPAQAVGALADDAPQSAIHEGTAVQAVQPAADGGDVRLQIEHGAEMHAGAVVLATNAYTSMLAETISIAPVRAQMLATAPDAQAPSERPTYSNFGYRYWRRRDDGRFLLGGWRDTAREEEVGTDATPNPKVQQHLDIHLREMGVPQPVTHRWAGIMGFSPDELPLVGAVPGMRNVYVCGGYTGHGMGFALHATRRLAAHLLDGEPLPAWLRADRLADRL